MTIHYDMPDREYHSRPELSSTQARWILDSPARYKYLTSQPARTSDAFDLGHAVHAKVLGVGGATVEYPDEHLTPSGAVSTKAATIAWANEQRDNGLIPITTDQARQVNQMAENVLAHPEARALFEQPGHAEASVFAKCDETGIDVRARFDYLPDLNSDNPIAVDLKTTAGSASVDEFRRTVAKWGYHVQQGHYLDALRLAAWRNDTRMRFVVVEKTAPYFVAVHELDDYFSDIGIESAHTARRTLRNCIDTDTWPTGLEDVGLIDAPHWLINDEIEV